MAKTMLETLRSGGFLNEITPDIGELCSEPVKQTRVAFCYSGVCAGTESLVRNVEIPEARHGATWCPRCEHALVWTNPGLKGKRKLRGRA